jgi:hypothetical protein
MKKPNQTSAIDGMSLYEMCRWASLIDAVELVENKCSERKIDFESIDLQPLDILKYVDSMTDELYNNALRQT